MKKIALRLLCAVAMLCTVIPIFASCSGGGDAEESHAKNNVLYAWSGEFSEEKLKKVIETYKNSYIPFVDGKDQVSLEADFDVESYTVARLSKVDDSDTGIELNGYIDLITDTHRDERKITFNTDWWHRESEKMKQYTLWSYLVLVRDTEGGEHFYYFRVDYSG